MDKTKDSNRTNEDEPVRQGDVLGLWGSAVPKTPGDPSAEFDAESPARRQARAAGEEDLGVIPIAHARPVRPGSTWAPAAPAPTSSSTGRPYNRRMRSTACGDSLPLPSVPGRATEGTGPFRRARPRRARDARPHHQARYPVRDARTTSRDAPCTHEPRAFLQRPAAEALVRAHRALAAPHGFGLLVFDGYRPWRVTKLFWDVTPPEKHEFVADPAKGSKHNRGCAVDSLDLRAEIRTGSRDAERVRRDVAARVSDLRRRDGRSPRAARPAARGHGEGRIHRRAKRVVALQLQGLDSVSNSRRGIRRHRATDREIIPHAPHTHR